MLKLKRLMPRQSSDWQIALGPLLMALPLLAAAQMGMSHIPQTEISNEGFRDASDFWAALIIAIIAFFSPALMSRVTFSDNRWDYWKWIGFIGLTSVFFIGITGSIPTGIIPAILVAGFGIATSRESSGKATKIEAQPQPSPARPNNRKASSATAPTSDSSASSEQARERGSSTYATNELNEQQLKKIWKRELKEKDHGLGLHAVKDFDYWKATRIGHIVAETPINPSPQENRLMKSDEKSEASSAGKEIYATSAQEYLHGNTLTYDIGGVPHKFLNGKFIPIEK